MGYPKYIKDEASGIEVPNDKYLVYQEGIRDERERIYNEQVTSMPTGEITAWDFLQWFKKFWQAKKGVNDIR